MRKFKQLTYHDRLNIEIMMKKKYSKKEIAEFVGCDLSTIYRELKRGAYTRRNSDYTEIVAYSADVGQKYNETREKNKSVGVDISDSMSEYIRTSIRKKWSVRALVGYAETHNIPIKSYSTIYSYIKRGLIVGVGKKAIHKHKSKYKRVHFQKQYKLYPSISLRPVEVNSRSAVGHWELDTVVGKRNGIKETLLVLTERKTRFEIVRKMPDRTSCSVVECLKDIITSATKKIFHSITCDNGVEFSDYMNLSKFAAFYYCHAYSSWERGSNENANRLIRKIYPKGSSFDKLTSKDIYNLQKYINEYPRSIFNYSNAETMFKNEIDKIYVNSDEILKILYGI